MDNEQDGAGMCVSLYALWRERVDRNSAGKKKKKKKKKSEGNGAAAGDRKWAK